MQANVHVVGTAQGVSHVDATVSMLAMAKAAHISPRLLDVLDPKTTTKFSNHTMSWGGRLEHLPSIFHMHTA